MQDTSGTLKSTNTFWFDTFSNSFLTSAPVKPIEVEDYNYSNGVYQLDPIVLSGIDTNGLQVGLSGGYYVLDGTPEIDYHDNRTSTEGGWNDYRPDDFVGTIQGNREDIQDLNHPAPTTPPVSDPTRPDDGPRPQYAAAHVRSTSARTERANRSIAPGVCRYQLLRLFALPGSAVFRMSRWISSEAIPQPLTKRHHPWALSRSRIPDEAQLQF